MVSEVEEMVSSRIAGLILKTIGPLGPEYTARSSKDRLKVSDEEEMDLGWCRGYLVVTDAGLIL